MSKCKKIAVGEFVEDIYSVNDRYPLDEGQNFAKSEINEMFEIAYKKNTKLYLWDEGESGERLLFWYTADGDGGWNANWEFAQKNIRKIKDLKRAKTNSNNE